MKKDVDIFDVNIKNKAGVDQFVHTVKSGENTKPTIVCVHGYWSSNLTYSKILKPLSKDFNVYCIDWLGMGQSSRPEFELTDPEEILNFFTESLNDWSKNLGINDFTLVGHSFGGYCAGHFALKYPNKVN